jgi:hypothetical protein
MREEGIGEVFSTYIAASTYGNGNMMAIAVWPQKLVQITLSHFYRKKNGRCEATELSEVDRGCDVVTDFLQQVFNLA